MSQGAESGIDAPPGREKELADALSNLRRRIDDACRSAGRAPDSVRLLPVTKFFPGTDIEILYRLGCREFGESREQEASAKVASMSQLSQVRWHMIGHLQRNKAKSVVRWADTVHSVDSERLITTLDGAVGAARDAGVRTRPLRVLLQLSLDRDPGRGGIAPERLTELADQVENAPNLQLAGLMAIPPLDADPDAAFAELAGLHRSLLTDHPAATELSAGMSGDLESAIAHGSTRVRVGTALMGARPITSQ